MPLTNTELLYYDNNVLRLPGDKRTEYHQQVDRLIAELSRSIRNHTEIKITRVVKAGSFAKYTILRKTFADPVDVDVVFYISGRSIDRDTLVSLADTVHALLVKIYPNKHVEDFEIQRKAATVSFVRSGLKVDIVPVIEDPGRERYGWQFDIRDASVMQTCAPCQIDFVQRRKERDEHFRTLVRMGKRWRNQAELDPLKSFTIELIMAYILDLEGTLGSIEQRFRRFLLYIVESGLKEILSFPENARPLASFSDPVVIIDPVCSTNNVAARITESERQEIVAAARSAWETAHFASAENDNEVWKEIFGPRFQTEDQA